MLDILAITTPIFLIIGLGYLARAGGIIEAAPLQGIATFVMFFALPALVIRALTQNPLKEVFDATYLLAYGIGSLAVFTLGLALTLGLERKPLANGAIQALGMSTANSGFIGYPVAAMALGPPAAVLLALNMMIENLLIIPLALILAEMGQQAGNGLRKTLYQTGRRLVRNPILIGLLIGVLMAASGLSLPGPAAKVIDMLAEAAGPAALFVIGGSLYGLRPHGMALDMSQIAIGKLLLHPLAVLGIFLLLPDVDPLLITAALLFSCAPMISVYPLFGQRFGLGEIAAATLMVSTLVAFMTISLVLWLIHHIDLFAVA
ncbi:MULTISPECIES: AEC family transporter [Halomonas]|uniref:Malonate transporter n=1 Tax=Halomonas halophila TaxID=29573 RepID=A0ABQ0U4H3_9GAMM|nr:MULTISPECIES: AEC family transporter [Halomonas]MDR5888447.1 AEC family transporter [Halomonas salina]WJY07632.1 AEC family transporter [Halomonas halophila]GEK73086.1 malonate transporter [Halomonas halophila]